MGQSLGVLLSGKLENVNALNSGGSVALNTLNDLPHSENVEIEIDRSLQEPREPSDDYNHRGLPNMSSEISTVKRNLGFRSGLLIATLIAIITFQVPFHLLGSTSEEGYKQDSIMSNSLILFSSVVFISSVGVTIFILHEFPLKPWPHILILALFGSYMFTLKAVMPNEALVLFFISIPILLVCICGKTLAWFGLHLRNFF